MKMPAMKMIVALLAVPVFVLASYGSMAQPKNPPPAEAPPQAATDTAQPDTTKKPMTVQKTTPLASRLKPTKKQICEDKCSKSAPPGYGAAAAYSACMAQCMK